MSHAVRLTLFLLLIPVLASASPLGEANRLFESGKYFAAARLAYALKSEQAPDLKPGEADAFIATALARAGMSNSASYFFVKGIQSPDRTIVKKTLKLTSQITHDIGSDLIKSFLLKNTKPEDYDTENRSVFIYSVAKELVLTGKLKEAISFLNESKFTASENPVLPWAFQLKGTANALLGKDEAAQKDFTDCENSANDFKSKESGFLTDSKKDINQVRAHVDELEDLAARCRASYARTLYQKGAFHEADVAYDHIDKKSFVWPEILFEQGWNSFSRAEFNRTLGKLVSYKSPALQFIFNPEVDVLNAQTYLSLCLYDDVNNVIESFNSRYTSLGEKVKQTVETNSDKLSFFYELGKKALKKKPHQADDFERMLNRFVRSPYFQNLVSSESAIAREEAAAKSFSGEDSGFAGFLEKILKWRRITVAQAGGVFVKNNLMEAHAQLVSDFEKMSFIKLDRLKMQKDALQSDKADLELRGRGNKTPVRRDDQYFWSFNGEFWNDELGDYVFGLESKCTAN